ncbi:hypothetical protein A9Q96_04870 [Rhodobacterales bacterium 52_120_T64]|nr:hypothetical protein A9Q96_04870 [Rhodobacterales bacterium 52_120_T64]
MPEFEEKEIRKKIGDGSILGVSVDTAVFDKYGCHLDHPVLATLNQFKAVGTLFLLSEVVVREISSHISWDASETQRAFKKALKDHNRRWGLGRDLVGLGEDFQINVEAKTAADEQVEIYIDAIGAEIVPVAGKGDLSAEVFRRYFDVIMPFEAKDAKKHEFPDAFALLSLEQAAIEMNTLILCISPDKGWAAFAKDSAYLVVVPKLDLALSWFNDPEMLLTEKLIAFWKGIAPPELPPEIKSAFEYYLDGFWFEASCESGLHYEYEPISASIQYIDHGMIGKPIIVSSEPEHVTMTIKVTAKVGFEASFEFYAHDHADGDDVHVSSEAAYIEKDVPFEITLEVDREMEGNDVEILEVTVNSGPLSVDFGHVDPFPDEDPTHEKY